MFGGGVRTGALLWHLTGVMRLQRRRRGCGWRPESAGAHPATQTSTPGGRGGAAAACPAPGRGAAACTTLTYAWPMAVVSWKPATMAMQPISSM